MPERGTGPSDPVQPGVSTRRWGSRPGRLGVGTIIAATLLGLLVTVLAGSEPGAALGVCLVAGTVIAAMIVRLRAVYVLFPVPAIAYVTAAFIAGLIHDRAADISRTALTLNAVQWVAAGFVAMTTATAAAITIAVVRWAWWRFGSGGVRERRGRGLASERVPAHRRVPDGTRLAIDRRGEPGRAV